MSPPSRHILLDWTNNYGVRPFFPFNPRWYTGSFMFIAEPVLWGLFFLAWVMPWLLGLTDREIGARRTKFRGQGLGHFRACRHGGPVGMAVDRAQPGRRTAEQYPGGFGAGDQDGD